MNGGYQNWQYQPPRRSTAWLWRFLGAACAVTIFVTVAIMIHGVATAPTRESKRGVR